MSTSANSDPKPSEAPPDRAVDVPSSRGAGAFAPAPAANSQTSRSAMFFSAAFLAVVTLACFQTLSRHPFDVLVGPQRGGGNDLTAYYIGTHSLGRIGASRFQEFVRWNPYAATGGPRWGNPQSGCWYPPNWIFYLCDAASALSWMMVAHQWWGGFGVYLLCRRIGLSEVSSLAGGCFYLAAPYHVAHIGEGHYGQICVVAWIPWALLAYERFRRDPAAGLPRVALVLALSILAGHVQEAYYLAVALTLLAGVDAVHRLRIQGWAAAAGFFGRWCWAGLLTGALVAVDFVPCWMYAKQSLRGAGVGHDIRTQMGLDRTHLWQLLNPFALGEPEEYHLAGGFYCETLCYFGLIAVLLAAIGVVLARHRYPILRYACWGLVAFGFAFGSNGPVYWVLRALVPGVSSFRAPNRAMFLCAAVIAVLAAAGLEAIAQMTRKNGRQVRRRRAGGPAVEWAAAKLASLGRWQTGAWLVAVLGVGELALHAHVVLRTVPPENLRRGGPIVRFLQQRAGHDRILVEQQLLNDREAVEAGLYKAHGYEPVPLLSYAMTMRALNGRREPNALILGFEPLDLSDLHLPVLDLLRVRFAVVRPAARVDWERWNLVGRGRVPDHLALRGQTPVQLDYWILENRTALPGAFVVGNARVLTTGEDPVLSLTELDPRRQVLLSRDLLPAGPRSAFQPARIREYRANRVTVEVTLQQPGYLVLADTWYPGWNADDNGRPVDVVRANLVCRAVPLGPGRHVVVFRYGWSAYLGGVLLSALALVVAIRGMARAKSSEPAGS